MEPTSDNTRPLLGKDEEEQRETPAQAVDDTNKKNKTIDKIQDACHRQGCCKCLTAAVLLYPMNGAVFMLFVWIGDMLGDLGRLATYIDPTGYYLRREHAEMIAIVVMMITVLGVNLGTIYFLCKRSKQSNRFFKAGMAVFGCCESRKEYEEATVPLSQVLKNIWTRSMPCEMSCGKLLCLILLAVACFYCFVVLFYLVLFVDPDTEDEKHGRDIQSTPQGLLVFLCVPALALWAYVGKLACRDDFFVMDEEFLKSAESDAEEHESKLAEEVGDEEGKETASV